MQERRKEMVDLINTKGSVSFNELKEHFPNVSEMTLRRDLECLDQNRKIVRIHGGAKSVDVVIGTEDLFLKRSARNVENKKLIAEKAIKLIQPHSSIYVDSGSTATEFARVFPDGDYQIFTSGLSCALELARLSHVQVHVVGGQMNSQSLSMNGSRSISYLENINFAISFFGVTGYSSVRGFTCGEEEEYALKRAVIERSEKVVLLMDATKVGLASTFTFATPEDIDIVVTDQNLDVATKLELKQAGVTIY